MSIHVIRCYLLEFFGKPNYSQYRVKRCDMKDRFYRVSHNAIKRIIFYSKIPRIIYIKCRNILIFGYSIRVVLKILVCLHTREKLKKKKRVSDRCAGISTFSRYRLCHCLLFIAV